MKKQEIPCIFLPGVAVGRGLNEKTGQLSKLDTDEELNEFFADIKHVIDTEITNEIGMGKKLLFKPIFWEKLGVPNNLEILPNLFEKVSIQTLGTNSYFNQQLSSLNKACLSKHEGYNSLSTLVEELGFDGKEYEKDPADSEKEFKKKQSEREQEKILLANELDKINSSELKIQELGIPNLKIKDKMKASIQFTKRLIENPKRTISFVFLNLYRSLLNTKALLLFGDVFIYLNTKENVQKYVLEKLKESLSNYNSGPIVIFTHSFGGVIFWDMLTDNQFESLSHFKNVHWISVGSQVRVFDVLKLYSYQKKGIDLKTVKKSFNNVISSWLNCFDPIDPLSFLVKIEIDELPNILFSDTQVIDKAVRTSGGVMSSHNEYFKSKEFQKSVVEHLKKFFTKGEK